MPLELITLQQVRLWRLSVRVIQTPEALIQKAEAAQKLWAAKTALERADVLWRWYFLMKENKEELARIMTMEQGKSLTEARGEIDYAASFVRWFAEEARRIDGDV